MTATDVEIEDEQPPDAHDAERLAVELAPYVRPVILPSADEFNFIWQMANALAASQMVPKAARGKPADVAIVLLASRDLGIPMTMAFAKLNVIEGKLALSAEVMVALVLRDGHRIWAEDHDETGATACLQRRGDPYVARFRFTIEDAERAGLCTIVDGKTYSRDDNGKPKPWERYPKNLVWARAASSVVRMACPDVTAGISYTPEELSDEERWTAHPTSVAPPEVRDAIRARIDALPDDRKMSLRDAWSMWKLAPLSRLTVEEVPNVEDLLAKAEAIEVGSSDAPQPPVPADRVDDAPSAQEGSTSDRDAAVDTPDIGSIQHEPDVDGPQVFNGDTGYCAACGGPIWYDAKEPGWQHAEPDEGVACPGRDAINPAGPEIAVDALYAATHTPPDPKVRRLQIEVDVSKMSQTRVLQALGEAGLPIDGSPKTLKLRLVDHLAAQ